MKNSELIVVIQSGRRLVRTLTSGEEAFSGAGVGASVFFGRPRGLGPPKDMEPFRVPDLFRTARPIAAARSPGEYSGARINAP